MREIKLCEEHINGLGFLKAFGIVPKDTKAIKVDKASCVQCLINQKKIAYIKKRQRKSGVA